MGLLLQKSCPLPMLTAARKKDLPTPSFLARNWWVFLFFALCYLFYSHGMHKKKETLSELRGRFHELEEQRMLALEHQEELQAQVRSQTDPAWMEMTLIKGLGLVPDGQQKIYFEERPSSRKEMDRH